MTNSFTTTLYTKSTLISQPSLNNQTVALINSSFHEAKLTESGVWDITARRFPSSKAAVHPSLANLLGEKGVVAVVLDGETVVATASAIPFPDLTGSTSYEKKKAGESFPTNWELKVVASSHDRKYRGKGLASRACAAVEEAVKKQSEERGQEKGELTFWIQTEESRNGAYWQRRGFTEVYRTIPPVGEWGSLQEFVLAVLVKGKNAGEVDTEKLSEWLQKGFQVNQKH